MTNIPAQPKIVSFIGKDYLTLKEAASYACVSVSQFRAKAKNHDIYPIPFMGKMVYRRADIQLAIEKVASP